MNAYRTKLVMVTACMGAMLISGCVTQPATTTQQAAEKSPTLYATGSRLGVKNTTELIGLKTIDQENIRNNKMFTNIVVDGK